MFGDGGVIKRRLRDGIGLCFQLPVLLFRLSNLLVSASLFLNRKRLLLITY